MNATQIHTSLTREQVGQMVETSEGRIALHVIALRLDGNLKWHFEGIMRELRALEIPPTHGLN